MNFGLVVLLRAFRLRRDAVAKAVMLNVGFWNVGLADEEPLQRILNCGLSQRLQQGGVAKDICDHFAGNPNNTGRTSTGISEIFLDDFIQHRMLEPGWDLVRF